MIQVMFFLRFRTQLRRIRTEMIASLEKGIVEALEAAGGKVLQERRLFSAVFDEGALGFWLDMLFVIRTIIEKLEKVNQEIQGYSCVFSQDIPDYDMERLCRTLALEAEETGIWCSPKLRKFLDPYVDFAPPLSPETNGRIIDRSLVMDYVRIKNIKPLAESPADRYFLYTKTERAITRGARQNAVLLGPEFIGKREGLYHYCAGILEDIPPLVIRFGSGGRGLCCYGDAWRTPRLRSFIAGHIQPAALEELDALEAIIFRERLRNELSKYIVQKGRDFLQLVLKSYIAAVRKNAKMPVVILENIHRADEFVARIFIDTYTVLQPEIKSVLIYGTCTGEERLKFWGGIFPRIIKFSSGDLLPLSFPEIPPDLWEFSYAIYLLGMFFPGILIPRLLEEEGKNPLMISLVFAMLSRLGVVDYTENPIPRGRDFALRAEAALGERKGKVQALVRRRLLSWVRTGRLRPCFNLLRILVKLGEDGGDELILKTICGDIINGTYEDIERTIEEGDFERITGSSRSPALLYIFKTLKALNYGNEAGINAAFQAPAPEEAGPLYYDMQILLNLTSYYLGINDTKNALETVKKAMLLSQEKNENSSRAYRLFSLVNLIKGQIGEAVEYISFSIENAEKTDQADELAVAAYYGAGIQFLFGNISKAQRLARQAEEAASVCGQGRWADRALFLRGKLFFETGRYQDALDIFRFLERYPSGISSGEKEHVLSAWIFRTSLYLKQSITEKINIFEGDFSLFELEAAYLTGDYQRALELAGQLSSVLPGTNLLYAEQPDWRSGFAQCETLIVPLGELRHHIISTYQSLAIGRLSAVSPEGSKNAVQYMQRLTRNEILPDMEPQEVFYFYALYRVLQDAGASQIDMNTAVSMAFKRLQRRASRIDDPETKRDFLNLNHWNKALGLVAKEYKLI
jgi:tetratricopeptide (TPR) repeat protein